MTGRLLHVWYAQPVMARFVVRRLVIGLLLCISVTFVAFLLTQVVPGDPIAASIGDIAASDPEIVAAFKQRYGLDRPFFEQYAIYLGNLLQGDLGMSIQSRRPVTVDLAQYMAATIELAVAAMTLAMLFGLTLGMAAAVHRTIVRSLRYELVVLIVVGLVLGGRRPIQRQDAFVGSIVALYVFFYLLGISPGVGRLPPGAAAPPSLTGMFTVDALLAGDWRTLWEALAHLALPAVVLAVYTIGAITRFTRASVLEALGQDYVRSARAKGLPERIVLMRHVLRPALAAIVTVSGLAFGRMLGGAVLVESVFSWPGLGEYAYRSALALDLRAIMGVSLVVAVIYIFVNLIVDILYALIDPRIRLG